MSRVGRRTLLKAGLSAGIGLGLVSARPAAQDEAPADMPKKGDFLVEGGKTAKKPLTPRDIRPGSRPIVAYAMDPKTGRVRNGSRFGQVLLVRLDAKKLTRDTRARAADGIVAYTAICTHTGCDVTDWFGKEEHLHCPCHGSTFDPADSARVLDGIAPRPLPALPLSLDQGKLRVAGSFTAEVGFESV